MVAFPVVHRVRLELHQVELHLVVAHHQEVVGVLEAAARWPLAVRLVGVVRRRLVVG